MDLSFTNSREEVAAAKRVETDWAALRTGQQIRSLEVAGLKLISLMGSSFKTASSFLNG